MRYFFHIRTPRGLIEDREGMQISDAAAALAEAAAIARELAKEFAAIAPDVHPRRSEIRDDGGLPLQEDAVPPL
jgi:hypothetical protein